MLGKAGQLLERSIVDRVVWAPERLVFEGPPILMPPVVTTQVFASGILFNPSYG